LWENKKELPLRAIIFFAEDARQMIINLIRKKGAIFVRI